MPTQPTTTPPQWNASESNREEPSDGLKTNGFPPDIPVPDKVHNWIFGVLFAWANYFATGILGGVSNTSLVFFAAASPWIGNGSTVAVTRGIAGTVEVTNNGGSRTADSVCSPVVAGGTISAVKANVIAVNNAGAGHTDDARVEALVSDVLTNTALYGVDVTATGVVTLAYVSGTPPTAGPLTIEWTAIAGDGTGDSIEVNYFSLEF